MPDTTTTFQYLDPSRHFDGTPYEAAARSVEQARQLMLLLAIGLRDANTQARNAYMSRNLDTGQEDPGAIQWDEEAQARALAHVVNQVTRMESALVALHNKLKAVEKAAAYDPKHPPREISY